MYDSDASDGGTEDALCASRAVVAIATVTSAQQDRPVDCGRRSYPIRATSEDAVIFAKECTAEHDLGCGSPSASSAPAHVRLHRTACAAATGIQDGIGNFIFDTGTRLYRNMSPLGRMYRALSSAEDSDAEGDADKNWRKDTNSSTGETAGSIARGSNFLLEAATMSASIISWNYSSKEATTPSPTPAPIPPNTSAKLPLEKIPQVASQFLHPPSIMRRKSSNINLTTRQNSAIFAADFAEYLRRGGGSRHGTLTRRPTIDNLPPAQPLLKFPSRESSAQSADVSLPNFEFLNIPLDDLVPKPQKLASPPHLPPQQRLPPPFPMRSVRRNSSVEGNLCFTTRDTALPDTQPHLPPIRGMVRRSHSVGHSMHKQNQAALRTTAPPLDPWSFPDGKISHIRPVVHKTSTDGYGEGYEVDVALVGKRLAPSATRWRSPLPSACYAGGGVSPTTIWRTSESGAGGERQEGFEVADEDPEGEVILPEPRSAPLRSSIFLPPVVLSSNLSARIGGTARRFLSRGRKRNGCLSDHLNVPLPLPNNEPMKERYSSDTDEKEERYGKMDISLGNMGRYSDKVHKSSSLRSTQKIIMRSLSHDDVDALKGECDTQRRPLSLMNLLQIVSPLVFFQHCAFVRYLPSRSTLLRPTPSNDSLDQR
uniref:Uncharacterized protein n=1 Tax=Corethron hystrix TaxID=216773 RepID=A0A7S1G0X9_9STRA